MLKQMTVRFVIIQHYIALLLLLSSRSNALSASASSSSLMEEGVDHDHDGPQQDQIHTTSSVLRRRRLNNDVYNNILEPASVELKAPQQPLTDNVVSPATATLLNCDHPLPYLSKRHLDNELINDYEQYYHLLLLNYQKHLSPGTFQTDGISTTFKANKGAEFLLWGPKRPEAGILQCSALERDNPLTMLQYDPSPDPGIQYMNPDLMQAKRSIDGVTELDPNTDYAVFVIYHHSVYAHFFLDYLPFIAYLKETLPPTTKLILANAGPKDNTRRLLQHIDPIFEQERIQWIHCSPLDQCHNQLVRFSSSNKDATGSMTIYHPKSSIRHMELLVKAREWITEKYTPPPTKSTIVYYSRNSPDAAHGRAMNIEQEKMLIQMIRDSLVKHNRSEELVVFDGGASHDMTFVEQLKLFQSASVVIGAHGGGLANLIFASPSETCQERPKVIEFITNPRTPDVQPGSWARTYWFLYTTIPWVEYHQVLFEPPSDVTQTYINLDEFQDSLDLVLAGTERESTSFSSTLSV